MSDLLQPGTPEQSALISAPNLRVDAHPDADQLSAFLEEALPQHEREETLAHLAICPRCRQITGLAAVEAPAIAAPTVVQARQPWFKTWRLAWPVAAFATAVLIALNVHQSAPPQLGPPQNLRAAAAVSAASPTAPARSSVASAPAPSAMPGKETNREPALAAGSSSTISAAAKTPAFVAAARARSTASIVAGAAAPASSIAMTAPVAAPAPPSAALASKSTTVAVSNQAALGMEAAPADRTTLAPAAPLAAPRTAMPIAISHPLPSRLATLSLSNAGGKTLALDAEHHLFLTEDGGQHWRSIPSAWSGQAMRVDLVARAGAGNALTARAAVAGRVMMQSAAAPAKATATGDASLSGTVIDPTGAFLPGAKIEVAPAQAAGAKAVTASAIAGSNGAYAIPNLPPGTYRVTVTRPGFAADSTTVSLASRAQTVSNFALTIGSASETVEVEASNADLPTLNANQRNTVRMQPRAPIFEIATDRNETWVSPDGVTWTRRN